MLVCRAVTLPEYNMFDNNNFHKSCRPVTNDPNEILQRIQKAFGGVGRDWYDDGGDDD
jgi:hypothetical protein